MGKKVESDEFGVGEVDTPPPETFEPVYSIRNMVIMQRRCGYVVICPAPSPPYFQLGKDHSLKVVGKRYIKVCLFCSCAYNSP